MPTSDNGIESHVSAAFSRDNVAFHGTEDEIQAMQEHLLEYLVAPGLPLRASASAGA